MLSFLVCGLFVAAFNIAKSGCQNLDKFVNAAFIFSSLCSVYSDLHYMVAFKFQPQSQSDPSYPDSGYSPLSPLAPRNLILSISSTFVSLFQALPNQSQNLIRYLQLRFSASLLVAHLICRHCPYTDTGPLPCFPF